MDSKDSAARSADHRDAPERPLRVAVLQSSWYPKILAGLLTGALAALRKHGVEDEHTLVIDVPGAYELPQAAARLIQSERLDAIVALGCVLRGETPHFDHVARSVVDGLLRVAMDSGVPVGLGVITADTIEQAQARSSTTTGKGGNKGIEAADAALGLAATFRALDTRAAHA